MILRELNNNDTASRQLAKAIADRHQNFSNEYIDNRCKERSNAHKYNFSYRLQKISPQEIERSKQQSYMLGANL